MIKVIKTSAAIFFVVTSISNTTAATASTALSAQNAYEVCTRADMNWINFCNGLIQGYADYAVLSGNACFPVGITRTQLVTLFTSNLLKMTNAYKNNQAALLAAQQAFELAYPCKSS